MRLAINGACYCLGKGTPERLEHYTRNVCNAKCEIMGATLLIYEKGHSGQIDSLN